MGCDEWLSLTLGAVLVNNIILSRIMGTCPFLGVSKKIETALGMGGAVIFVMAIASFATASIYAGLQFLFRRYGIDILFTRLLLFILVIAALVQIVEIALQKFSPFLYNALGIYLPLITTNCAVLGAAELNVKNANGILASTVFGTCSGIGFALALLLFASIRERLELSRIPRSFQGAAIALITAGILSMSFLGFSGLVK